MKEEGHLIVSPSSCHHSPHSIHVQAKTKQHQITKTDHSNFTTTNFRLPPFSPHLPPIEKELNYTKGKRRENNARRRWEERRSTRRGSGKWKPKWKRKRNGEKGFRS
jgi:transposase